MSNWLEEAIEAEKNDPTPIEVYENQILFLMVQMRPTHRTREPMPAGSFTLGGGSKSSKKRQKSTKPTLATLNQRLYTQI